MTARQHRNGFVLAVLALVLPRAVHAQSAIPATEPTASPQASITPSQLPSANPPVAAHTLKMEWDGHLLQIQADGSSLSSVLQQMAQRTNTKIFGTPPDGPVYGTYGPAPLVDIVAQLTDGLQTNTLFIDTSAGKPAQLTFLARGGGASPAQAPYQQPAQQAVFDEAPSSQPQQPQRIGGAPVASAIPVGTSASVGADASTTPAQISPAPAGTNPPSPNGVRTPQEIFEQLQRLRANAAANKQ